jgi:FemAB-related protein (PEP-CTERM system-associated)
MLNDAKTRDISIVPLSDGNEIRWDTFVLNNSDATFFHLAGWRRVIRNTFGYKTHFVYAERDGKICGILPLVHTGKGLFGNRLVSTSFCVQGGPIAVDESTCLALDYYAIDLAEKVNADWLEFRSTKPNRPDWVCRSDLYYIFRREIDPSPEENLKLIPRKQRAVIRKALKAGLLNDEIDWDPERFYKVYSLSVRNLGSPVFSERYCRELKREFRENCEFLTVVGPGGQPVSSVVSFYFKDEVLPYYGGGTPEARGLGAQAYMYYRLMCRAAERGVRIFDFGRSKRNTGAFSFKEHFGFEPQPLNYEFMIKEGRNIPEHNTLNPGYQKFISIWQKMPLFVANLVGPYLVKRLG